MRGGHVNPMHVFSKLIMRQKKKHEKLNGEEAAEMWFCRRLLQMSWMQKKAKLQRSESCRHYKINYYNHQERIKCNLWSLSIEKLRKITLCEKMLDKEEIEKCLWNAYTSGQLKYVGYNKFVKISGDRRLESYDCRCLVPGLPHDEEEETKLIPSLIVVIKGEPHLGKGAKRALQTACTRNSTYEQLPNSSHPF